MKNTNDTFSAANTSGAVRTETLCSLLILLVLLAITGSVLVKQADYPEEMFAQQAAAKGPETSPTELEGIEPASFRPMGPAETFDRATLSDKIDGKADLYLESGFKVLKARRFVHREDTSRWYEVYLYDMGTARNAFALYSLQRRPEAVDSDLTAFAYSAANALFLMHGRYYLEMIASAAEEGLARAMETTAERLIARSPAEPLLLPEMEFLPGEGLEARSIKLHLHNAFSFDQFKDVLSATYAMQGRELTAFVCLKTDAREAALLRDRYRSFLLDFGAEDVSPAAGTSPEITVLDVFGEFELLFCRGRVLAGVHGAADRGAAEALLQRMDTHISGRSPES